MSLPTPCNLPMTEAYFNSNVSSTTAGNLTPFLINAIAQMLRGKKNFRQADELLGANEPTLSTIFGDGINP
jgi:hypothetical protein